MAIFTLRYLRFLSNCAREKKKLIIHEEWLLVGASSPDPSAKRLGVEAARDTFAKRTTARRWDDESEQGR